MDQWQQTRVKRNWVYHWLNEVFPVQWGRNCAYSLHSLRSSTKKTDVRSFRKKEYLIIQQILSSIAIDVTMRSSTIYSVAIENHSFAKYEKLLGISGITHK